MSDNEVPSVELYPEVIVFATFIIIYTCGSVAAAGFTHLLFRLNGKQVVYVSLMSLSIFLQNILTVTQESFSIALWPLLQIETYEMNMEQWRNPEASIVYQTSPNVAIKILFEMRTYFFNVESLLFFFWSLMLFVSVWEIESRILKSEKFVAGTKYFCFILPIFQLVLTNLEPIIEIPTLHLIFGNCTMAITLTLGCIFMGLILARCLLVMWTSNWTHKVRAWRGYDNGHGRNQPGHQTGIRRTISNASATDGEDRYILLRFLAGFAVIGGLQTSYFLSQLTYAQTIEALKEPLAPRPHLGWTTSEQLADWAFYLASASTGYLMLAVFGTTRESRRQIRRIWAEFRGKVPYGKKDEEYISFRSDSNNNTDMPYDGQRRGSSPSSGLEQRARSREIPPKPMTFVSSRTTPLGSPDGGGARPFSPGYADVDLKTPRL
ncbi:hypothetical protein P167DRAFT_104873 [Morchella conica CCBAS932]|uniref:Uncharacterized protein n=1 Tax=Morchella conica CCBAS932 TaxID=1392247 RepID=A0A3N4KSU8_9PEZI|nr:hypothetical protein P167DRAFT_104873 [Morchella conica CCBAS932]